MNAAIKRAFAILASPLEGVAAFLGAGMPLIISTLNGPADLVEEYQCGAVVDDAEELPSALGMVRSRYDEVSANAMEAFDAGLSVDRHLRTVLTLVADLAHSA